MGTNAVIDLTLDTDSEAELQQPSRRAAQPLIFGGYAARPSFEVPQGHHMLSVPGNSPRSRPYFRGPGLSQRTPSRGTKTAILLPIAAVNHVMPNNFQLASARVLGSSATNGMEPSGLKRACLNCISDPDVSCDGEQPCSACSEPGFDCVYPGDDKKSRSRTIPQSVSDHGPQSIPFNHDSRPLRPTQHQHEYSAASPQLHAPSLNSVRYRFVETPYDLPGLDPAVDAVEDYTETNELGDSSNFDLDSLEGVKYFLKLHESRLRAHREGLTRPLLARAKLECLRNPKPTSGRGQRNPFASLQAKSQSATWATPIAAAQFKSHGPGASKKWTPVAVRSVVVQRDPTILPKYKSIGRLGATVLATNSYVKKYLPYFADELPDAEKKREEDIAKWYQTDHDSMHRQRDCLERVQLWKPAVDRFISNLEIQYQDVLWFTFSKSSSVKCRTCEESMKRAKFGDTFGLIPKPDERSATRARLASEAVEEVAQIHIWHILGELDFVKQMLAERKLARKSSSTLCSICFLHDCMTHGAFEEPSEEASGTFAFMGGDGGKRRPMMINDNEEDVNHRVSVVVPYDGEIDAHICGIYCVDSTTSIKAILGRRLDGGIGGIYNRNTHVSRPTFENKEECSQHCFWHVAKRHRFDNVRQAKTFDPKLSSQEKQLFESSLRLHAANQRAPCMIAKDIDRLTCMDAFYYILATIQNPMHFEQARLDMQESSTQKQPKIVQNIDTSMSSQLDDRPPFIPCSHEGSCHNNPDCSCSDNYVHCEYFCGCSADCKRRFSGCSCAGKNKACFNDDRCECWAQNRECDPWLCQSCGAVEVLDPANKYREEIRRGRCRNVNLQLELPAKTIKAPSEVQGWGLYAGQDLESYVFIGEYKGEIVGNQESDRRGSIYHHLGQEYLFVTNNEQQIDGSNFGNKTRFINNSQRHDYINVLAKKLLCYGVQRVMLYTKRPIKVGDELLYNYNYPDSVTKTFWERGEGPANVSGAVVAKPTLPTTGRIAKVADTTKNHHATSRSRGLDPIYAGQLDRPSRRRDEDSSRSSSKRKRIADIENGRGGGSGQLQGVHARVINDSDMSEDELVAMESTENTSDEADTGPNHVHGAGTVTRHRRVHASDKRFGGNAQRKAWDTRKSRTHTESE